MEGAIGVISGWEDPFRLAKSGGATKITDAKYTKISTTKEGSIVTLTFDYSDGAAEDTLSFIFSAGSQLGPQAGGSAAKPLYHSSRKTEVKIDTSASSANTPAPATVDSRTQMIIAHGSLMAIAWCLIAPSAIVIARHFRNHDPLWFKLHRFMQYSVVIITTIAISLAFSFGSGPAMTSHKGIGITVFVLALIQPIVAFVRPHKGEPNRKKFNNFHHLNGYAMQALGFANCMIGLNYWRTDPASVDTYYYLIAAAVVYGLVFLLGLVFEFTRNEVRKEHNY